MRPSGGHELDAAKLNKPRKETMLAGVAHPGSLQDLCRHCVRLLGRDMCNRLRNISVSKINDWHDCTIPRCASGDNERAICDNEL